MPRHHPLAYVPSLACTTLVAYLTAQYGAWCLLLLIVAVALLPDD